MEELRMTWRGSTWLAVVAAAAMLVACDSTDEVQLDAAQASQGIGSNVASLFDGLTDASDFLDEDGDLFGCPTVDGVASDPDCVEMTGNRLVEPLRRLIFAPGNLESSTDTSVTYLLRASTVCGANATGPRGEESGPRCAELLNELQFRIEVTSPAEGDFDLALLFGAARHNPIDLRIYRDELGVVLDLAPIRATLLLVAGLFGEDLEADLPETMTGSFGASLVRNAAKIFTADFSILSAIDVGSARADAPYRLQIAQATPAASVQLDGVAKKLTTTVSIDTIDASFPRSLTQDDDCLEEECTEAAPLPGTFAVHLAGVSAQSTFTKADDTFQFVNVGLGDEASTISLDGQTVVAVDLNAAHGRRFDLTATNSAQGSVELQIAPAFDLQVALDLQHLADPEIPAWTHDEDLRVSLDGAAAPSLIVFDDVELQDGVPTAVAKVATGTLTISGKTQQTVVGAGECLLAVDGTEEVHPVSLLSSGACP